MSDALSNMVAVAARLERDLTKAELRVKELEEMSNRQAAALVAIAKHLGTQPELGALVAGAAALIRERDRLVTQLADRDAPGSALSSVG